MNTQETEHYDKHISNFVQMKTMKPNEIEQIDQEMKKKEKKPMKMKRKLIESKTEKKPGKQQLINNAIFVKCFSSFDISCVARSKSESISRKVG